MNKYFLGLIIISFVGTVVMALSPKGASRAYLKLLCGLCSIGCIAIPLLSVVGGGSFAEELISAFEYKSADEEAMIEIYNSALNGVALDSAEKTLKSEIIKELSTKSDALDVDIILNKSGEDFYISRVVVTIYPSGYALNPREISKICKSRLSVDCEFVYS